MRPRVAVVGGGITGLAAAHRLRELAPEAEVVLLEASSRLGGVLETRQVDGFLLEAAADGFLTTPAAAVNMCQRLDLAESLQSPDARHRRAFVVCRGRLQPVPEGFTVLAPSRLWPLVTSPIMSLRGKARAAWEWFVPPRRDDDDESLQSFVCRRFGRQVYERLAQPLVGGIYTADPERLSIEATMPRFRQMEREHRSLLRAMLHNQRTAPAQPGSGARYAQFAAPQQGMSSLVAALARQLSPQTLRLDSPVDAIVPLEASRWLLSIGGPRPERIPVDGLIVATPAYQSARMLEQVDGSAAAELREIDYASCAIVSLGYRRDQIGHALDGFGFVVPLAEDRMILSCSFASVKYGGRAPEDEVLLRVFIGGACQAGLLRLRKSELMALAEAEVSELLAIRGQPSLKHIVYHPRAMPQYHVGHRRRVAGIEASLERYPTLALAGSALHGVGVPSCVQSGESAAERLAAVLPTLAAQPAPWQECAAGGDRSVLVCHKS